MSIIRPDAKDSLKVLWGYIGRRRRRQVGLVMCLSLVSAFVEVVSLGAVVPFLGILVAPEQVFGHPGFANISASLGFTAADQLILPLSVVFATAALLAGTVRISLSWASTRLAVSIGADLSLEVYRRTLYQPYQVHVARNSSEVISGITVKVQRSVFGVILPLLTLVSSTVLLVAIVLTLFAIDPLVALLAFLGFGVSYGLITWLTRHRLVSNSERIAYEQTQVIKALQEGLGGIRDVLLNGTQASYCEIYRRADYPLRRADGNNIFIGGMPRFAMEALGMMLIAALAYFLSLQAGGIATALPVLGALALGAQRLLPALQQIYNAWASITGSRASLIDTLELLEQPLPVDLKQPVPAPLLFQKDIQFRDVYFRYSGGGPWVLDGLSLNIAKGSRVGFVGSTGSGKSTTLDLLMGLLPPNEGELLVDSQRIAGSQLRSWQQNIAHVPQSIYLADATVAENIAFGVPPDAIDLVKVQQAARQAQIADFIESIPEGYQTHVGERGTQLSGGQSQRIGIARALYRQASVLVFDEATSALDNVTEQAVMDAIEGLADVTILFIAHRLTTLRHCDFIVELEHGRVVAQGTYEYLLESSPTFYKKAKAI